MIFAIRYLSADYYNQPNNVAAVAEKIFTLAATSAAADCSAELLFDRI
jgi:hypothetical protein